MQKFFALLLWLGLYCRGMNAAVALNKVVVRVPKLEDIGLIFGKSKKSILESNLDLKAYSEIDLTIVNTQVGKKELLDFRIRADGTCCVNLTNTQIMVDASRIVGGNFGRIDPGVSEVVSLIWPTVSLFNRVGFCPIMITAKDYYGLETQQKHVLHFDTRFTTLDPTGQGLRKHKDYKDCNNWDKDYLANCTPVNCEERYFGQRNFYNITTEQCEQVPRCGARGQIYDYYGNECVMHDTFFTAEDEAKIHAGNFIDENEQIAREQMSSGPHLVINVPGDRHNLTTDDYYDTERYNTKRAAQFFGNSFCGTAALNEAEPSSAAVVKRDESILPYWLKGLLDGLLIVLATIGIYVLICFLIFLIVSWVTRGQTGMNKGAMSCVVVTPTTSNDMEVYTPSSLLSQR